jgi:hypothetical protein
MPKICHLDCPRALQFAKPFRIHTWGNVAKILQLAMCNNGNFAASNT